MQENNHLLHQLEQMLHWKKSKKVYAEKLGVSELIIDDLLKELKNREQVGNEAEAGNYIGVLEELVIKVNNEKGTLESTIETSFEPKDDIELAKLHKINLEKYKISNYWTKQKSNGKFTSSVFATLRKPADYTAENFAKFLENYTPREVRILHKLDENFYDKETVDVEISIADFHLAKKTLEGETISNKKDQFACVLRELTHKVSSCYRIRKIVFPISNDFFHTDNYQNSTTNGTPQDVLVSYDHEYEEGFDILVQAISFLSAMCDSLEVVLVQGNHDRTKSFFLAHALEVFFKDGYNVTFQRHHSTTKSVVLGNTFIGYHHGNCKIEDLPLVFATGSDSVSFGNAKYREVHTGDKHHYMAKEIKGVRIQQMPSLSGTDRWHADNNYVNNIRAGLALIYHPEHGKIGEFESRI
jgi:DNA repair exonuclease SbcCD nuclease subunit